MKTWVYLLPTQTRTIILTIRLPEDIEIHITEMAAKTGRTKIFHAKEVVIENCTRLMELQLDIGVVDILLNSLAIILACTTLL
ncbi:MAG: putative DNA-binding protein [Arenicella sp.]